MDIRRLAMSNSRGVGAFKEIFVRDLESLQLKRVLPNRIKSSTRYHHSLNTGLSPVRVDDIGPPSLI